MLLQKVKTSSRQGLVTPLLLACAILGVDFLSKSYVHLHLPLMSYASPFYPYGGIPVFQNWGGIDFSINHAINKGAAWGIFAAFQNWLLVFRIVVIASMASYLLFFNKESSKVLPFVAIIAGATGNVIDYFVYGHVIDIFHFKFWNYTYPIFNVADSAIFCGIACLFLQSLWSSKKKNSSKKVQEEA